MLTTSHVPTCVAVEFLNEISTLSIHLKILGAFLMVGLLMKLLSHNIIRFKFNLDLLLVSSPNFT